MARRSRRLSASLRSALDGAIAGALQADGNLVCWGGQPDGNQSFDQAVVPEGRFSQVSVSAEKLGEHSCAVRWGGTLVCWGSEDAPTPAGRFSQVSAGEGHGCALRWDGGLVCWGNNEHGQAEPPAGRFSQVSAGGEEYYYPSPRMNDYRGHSCAVRADGGLVCWGYNGDRRAEAPPGRFSQVSAGVDHSCALRVGGGVVCWGSNEQGQTEAPTGRFSQVSAGYQRSCALRSDGGVICWGWDWSGYGLGLGELVAAGGPVQPGQRRRRPELRAARRRCRGLLGDKVGRPQRQRRAVSAHRTDRVAAASCRPDRVRLPAAGGAWIWPALRFFLAHARVARWPISAEVQFDRETLAGAPQRSSLIGDQQGAASLLTRHSGVRRNLDRCPPSNPLKRYPRLHGNDSTEKIADF